MNIAVAVFLLLPFGCQAQSGKEVPYIQNGSFVSNTFGFPATIPNFQKNYGNLFVIHKEAVRNIHDEAIIDTVYTFSNGKTTVEIYKARDRDLLQSMCLVSEKIPLKFNIRIGDRKADVAARLKTKISANQVRVGNLEQTQVYLFTFLNDRLASVVFETVLD